MVLLTDGCVPIQTIPAGVEWEKIVQLTARMKRKVSQLNKMSKWSLRLCSKSYISYHDFK